MGAVAPYAALIITHLSVVSSRQQSIMIGEDVMNKLVAYCFIWNLAELHEVKAAEEVKKVEAESVVKRLLASGMSADEILEKLCWTHGSDPMKYN